MRIPNLFTAEKNYDKNIEELLKGPEEKENFDVLQDLLESCYGFIEKCSNYFGINYNLSRGLVNSINYKKSHIEDLSQKINFDEHSEWLGLHFSILVNKIMTEQDKINLIFSQEISWLGSYLDKGTLIIQGDAGNFTGCNMQDGKLIIQKNTGDYTGLNMLGGEITVKGNAGNSTGWGMKGGKLVVKGKIENISGEFIKGTIIEGNKIVKHA